MSDAVAPQCARQVMVPVVANRQIARDTFLMRLDDPQLAEAIEPGQFLMVRPTLGLDPLLGRPFALYDVARDANGAPAGVEIVYLVMGRGTSLLSRLKPGERVAVWGPLGHPFGPPPVAEGPIVYVAGGIGQTPFLSLARQWTGAARYGVREPFADGRGRSVVMYYGVRGADLLAGVEDFRTASVDVRIATDDGSAGFRGFVTDLLANDLAGGLRPAKVVGCGPHVMLRALARLTAQYGIDCDLSLENHMACGFGACFSCVAPVRLDGAVDLKRVCVEGPVFAASSVVFD